MVSPFWFNYPTLRTNHAAFDLCQTSCDFCGNLFGHRITPPRDLFVRDRESALSVYAKIEKILKSCSFLSIIFKFFIMGGAVSWLLNNK